METNSSQVEQGIHNLVSNLQPLSDFKEDIVSLTEIAGHCNRTLDDAQYSLAEHILLQLLTELSTADMANTIEKIQHTGNLLDGLYNRHKGAALQYISSQFRDAMDEYTFNYQTQNGDMPFS